MERGSDNGDLDGAEEEVKGRLQLLYDIAAQMLSFGPSLAARMSFFISLYLPWGFGAAGAETVKRGVDTDNTEGVARMTADMVRLGMIGMVHDIVVTLCKQDRADAVAAVTAQLLALGEVVIVIQITNSLVASGHAGDAVLISGQLIAQGNSQIHEVIKECGLSLTGNDDKEEAANGERGQSDGVLGNVQRQAAQVLHRLTPGGSNEEEEKKTPDAEALFGDWTGTKAPDGDAPTPEDVPDQEDRLL